MGKKLLLLLLLVAAMGAGALARRPDLIDDFRDRFFHDPKALSEVLRRKVEASLVSIAVEMPKTDVRFAEPFKNTGTTGLNATRTVGNGFHLGNNRFVTNAHVFGLEDLPFNGPIYKATSRTGALMPIKKIVSFDQALDLAVFEVDPKYVPQVPALEIEPQPAVGMPVWPVAYQAGLQQFPVEVSTLLDTITFTGAPTAKLSGGVIVNSRGRVVGILNGKSGGNSQNQAIAASMIDRLSTTKTNFATKHVALQSTETEAVERYTYDLDVALPDTIEKIHDQLSDKAAQLSAGFAEDFAKKHAKTLFPRDPASRELLKAVPTSVFGFFTQPKKGAPWILDTPKYREIHKNGRSVIVGELRSTGDVVTLAAYAKHQELQQWLADPIQVADYLTGFHEYQAGYGNQTKPVQSWGQSTFSEKFSDRLGRVWVTNHWITPDGTKVFATNCTLLISRFACISGFRPSDRYYFERNRFRTIAHQYALTYAGTGTDWFIVQKNFGDWLPPSLKTAVDFNDRTDEFRVASAESEVQTVFEREIPPQATFTVAMGVPPTVESGYYPLQVQVTPNPQRPRETYTFQFYAHDELAQVKAKPEVVEYSSIGILQFTPPGGNQVVTDENMGNTGVALTLRTKAVSRSPASSAAASVRPVHLICDYGGEEPTPAQQKDCAKVGSRITVKPAR